MGLAYYLGQPFAQHALIAATLVAVTAGLIGPFVIIRNMAFAVHGTAELSFTGAAAGLVVADDPVAGVESGSVVVGSRSTASTPKADAFRNSAPRFS